MTCPRLARNVVVGSWLLLAAGAGAQLPADTPLPWSRPVERPVWSLGSTLWDDPAGSRQAVELGGDVLLPRGMGRWLWLHWSYVSADLGTGGAAARWPAAVDSAAAAGGWPGETVVSGWTRPVVGLLADGRLPGLGPGRLVLAGTLPFADNRLYPLAARSVALDLAWRRERDLGPGRWFLALRRQWQFHASGEALTPAAFPSLTAVAAGISFPAGKATVTAAGTWVSHRDGRWRLACALPVGDGWTLAATWRRDLTAAGERSFRDLLAVAIWIPAGGPPAAPETPAAGEGGRQHRHGGGWRHDP